MPRFRCSLGRSFARKLADRQEIKGLIMTKRLWSSALLLSLLFGCSNQGGSEFTGKWVNIKSEKRMLEIERNGETFMVRETAPSFIDGSKEVKNIPATLKDGTLQMNSGWGVLTLVVDKSSGHLTSGQAEFKRVK
jgi:hypothetical protein